MIVFTITLCDYKQLSYWARVVLVLTAITFIYVIGETSFRFYFLDMPEIKKDLTKQALAANVTKHVANSTKLNHAAVQAKVATSGEDQWLMSNGIYLFMPLWPNVINFASQVTGVYEGIPMVPPLYANARSKKNFNSIMRNVTLAVSGLTLALAPLSLITYGNELKDIVLLNLEFGALP